MIKLELARTLGELERLGMIKPYQDESTTRYCITGVPVDEEEEESLTYFDVFSRGGGCGLCMVGSRHSEPCSCSCHVLEMLA